MSIKELFEEKLKRLSNKTLAEIGNEVESSQYINEYLEFRERYVPHVDYSSASNFVRYGKAVKYYDDVFNRILNDYPYDGSFKERLEWHNDSSDFENWFFENQYPRTNGYIKLSHDGGNWPITPLKVSGYGLPNAPEYILVRGGPNVGPSGDRVGANIYDPNKNRESNLKLDLSEGTTVEFWLKKETFNVSRTEKEIVFDLSNNNASYLDASYGRLIIELTSSNPMFLVTALSGTNGFTSQPIGSNVTSSSLWHHYAFVFQNSGSNIVTKLYVDGEYNDALVTAGTTLNEVTGAMIASIGSFVIDMPGATIPNPGPGWALLSASLDEFRYWKTARSSKEIGRNWFTQIGAGTNTDDANTNLGVYYKFNRGISGDSAVDSTILDYSGRISNGFWINYPGSAARSTGSAMVEAGVADSEFRDPIIYSSHPSVSSLRTTLAEEAFAYDNMNNTSIYHSLPAWIAEEDNGHLLNLTQIMAQYFDQLQLSIENLPKLKDPFYIENNEFKPSPFSKKLVESFGLATPDLFVDSSVLEALSSRNEDEDFEEKLYNVKNQIYNNIYNNLVNIYKSKGTEKSFRNLIRCFGVDELISLNMYADNETYEFKENYRTIASKKNFVNFNHTDRFGGSVFQSVELGNPNSVYSYIPSYPDSKNIPITVEAEVIFPKKVHIDSTLYFETNFITSSLFGMHTALLPVTEYTWVSPDDSHFKVFAVRSGRNLSDVHFELTASNVNLTSSVFLDVYDNQKWNFAVRVYPAGWPFSPQASGSSESPIIELRGVSWVGDELLNSFVVSASAASSFLSNRKRIYVGAHRENFTGSVLNFSDVKVSSVRFWMDYLKDEELNAHARDADNYGRISPQQAAYLLELNSTGTYVPQEKTLALHWIFADNTSSNEFTVKDFSSGSIEFSNRYGWLSNIVDLQHVGSGSFFDTSNKVIDAEYINSARQNLPENMYSTDTISILNFDEQETFTKETRPTKHFFTFEKSMYRAISEEMLNYFATIKDFNTLIGAPINTYRQQYKSLEKLRQLFFERVENTPDIEKYLSYYKWIDMAVSKILVQLVPASANMTPAMRNMIENHVLERNKYWFKYPTLEFKQDPLETGIRSINELMYDWEYGHAPIPNVENRNCFWHKFREERDNPGRIGIFNPIFSSISRGYSTPYKLEIIRPKIFKGGSNPDLNKKSDYLLAATHPFGPRVGLAPLNVLLALGNDIKALKDCNDEFSPNEKKKHEFVLRNLREATGSAAAYAVNKGEMVTPISVISSSAIGGYSDKIKDGFGSTVDIFGLHEDTYAPNYEIPMQGVFTERHVGGHQSRHVPLNTGNDTLGTRPEAWFLLVSESGSIFSGSAPALSFTSPDYPWPTTGSDFYNESYARARFYRDEHVKRPLNIRNIKTTSSLPTVAGNFSHNYEVVNVCGRYSNDIWAKDNVDVIIPSSEVHKFRVNATSGNFNYELPTRGGSKSIIVNKFAAPGGPEVSSRGYLDPLHEELSVYNVTSFKNLSAILPSGAIEISNQRVSPYPIIHTLGDGLRTLLSRRCGQFGIDSAYGEIDSKTYNSTASYHKVNRNPVKRIRYSDTKLNAFTGSSYDNWYIQHAMPRSDLQYSWITSSYTSSLVLGYTPEDFLVTSSAGYTEAIVFASASDIYNSEIIHGDFVGLNTLIVDPIIIADNLLYSANGIYSSSVPVFGLGIDRAEEFNLLMLNRDGPYGYPSWKQLRHGEHAVSRHMKKNNRISISEEPRERTIVLSSPPLVFSVIPKNSDILLNYYESPVTKRFKPIRNTALPRIKTRISSLFPIKPVFSYGNNISSFANYNLNDKLGLSRKDDEVYTEILNYYNGVNINPPVSDFVNLIYSEVIYPKEVNMFMNKIRTRPNFDFNWRNVREDRTLENVKNSCDYTIAKQSMWPLDAREDFVNGPVLISGSGPTHINGQYGEGELQNDYTTFHMGDTGSIKPGALYNRRFPTWEGGPAEVYGGDALWEAPIQAGKYPFTQTYEEWTKDLKYVAKDFTIIPEFRISEHMDFYVNEKNGDFLADNPNMFSLTGSEILNSSTESFFRTYSHSDFMKYFGVVKKDYAEIDSVNEISLKCKGFIKFLPYNGFYPAQRSLDIVSLFSGGLANSTIDVITSSLTTLDFNVIFQNVLKPFFGPGIFFNTIKSGIAVDWPYTSENYFGFLEITGSSQNNTEDDAVARIKNGLDKRYNFEMLLELPNFFYAPLLDEPHPSASHFVGSMVPVMNVLQVSGYKAIDYKLAMHNFLAEVPNFFLKDNALTTIISSDSVKYDLLNQYSGQTFEMYVELVSSYPDLSRSQVVYNSGSSFGPPVDVRTMTVLPLLYYKDYTFSPYTPGFHRGYARAMITFAHDPTINYSSVEDILTNVEFNYVRICQSDLGRYFTATDSGLQLGQRGAMQISASLNMFQKIINKTTTFDALGSNPIEVSEDTSRSKWAIQTKFEAPILDFSEAGVVLPKAGYSSVPKGIWHQYGKAPNENNVDGVFIVIKDFSLSPSLADLVGFEKKAYPIGQVAEQKIISEAIVAVPFIIESNIPKFFNISKDMIRKAKLIAQGVQATTLNKPFPGDSIVEMVSKMEKYVFPPKMDFLKNESVEPFAMYIFEFEHALSQKDLADIWQNLPPDIMDRFEEKEVKISHPLLASALLKEMPDELRWMVFKVKKKANWNYYKLTADSRDDNRFKFDFELGRQDSQKGVEPSYSYNWPYDFFSLVELAQIEASVKIGEDYEAKLSVVTPEGGVPSREELFRREELLNNDERTPELSPIDKAKRKAAEEYLSQVNERINVPSTVQYGDQALREGTMQGNEKSDIGSSGPGTGPSPGIGPGGPGFNLPGQSNIPVDDSGRNRRPGRNSQVTTQNTPSNTARNPAANANSGITTSNSSNAASDADRGGRGSNNVTSNNIGGGNNAGSRKGRRRGR